jgi:hypothetical protein
MEAQVQAGLSSYSTRHHRAAPPASTFSAAFAEGIARRQLLAGGWRE